MQDTSSTIFAKLFYKNEAKRTILPDTFDILLAFAHNWIAPLEDLQDKQIIFSFSDADFPGLKEITDESTYQQAKSHAKESSKKLLKLNVNIIKKIINVPKSKSELGIERISQSVAIPKNAVKKIKQIVQKKMKDIENSIVAEITKNFTENSVLLSSSKISGAVHYNIQCNSCKIANIIGPRFKCSICQDFNLCEACEQECTHDQSHILIKIRKPEYLPTASSSQILANCQEPSISFSTCIVNSEGLSSTYLSSPEVIPLTFQANSEARKSIKLINNGKKSWPRNSCLACLEKNSIIKGRKVQLKIKIDVNKEINAEVIFDIKDLECGKYYSRWQMMTENEIHFGDVIKFEITIVPSGSGNKISLEEKKEIDEKMKKIINQLEETLK